MEQIKENNNRFFALLAVLLISIASFLFVNNYVLADGGNADEGGYSEAVSYTHLTLPTNREV